MLQRIGLLVAVLALVVQLVPGLDATSAGLLKVPSTVAAADTQPAGTAVVISASSTLNSYETFALRTFGFLGLATSSVPVASFADSSLPAPTSGSPVLWYATQDAIAAMTPAQRTTLSAKLQAGASGFVSSVSGDTSSVAALTGPELTGAPSLPSDTPAVSRFTSAFGELTRELAGQTFGHLAAVPGGSIQYQSGGSVLPVLEGTGSASGLARVVAVKRGQGTIVLQALSPNPGILVNPLGNLLSGTQKNGSLYGDALVDALPFVLFAKWAAGDTAWHSTRRLANLTIDDPPPAQPFWGYGWTDRFYLQVLEHARLHNFHVTIGTVPSDLWDRTNDVLSLFQQNPDRLSLIIHGLYHACPDFPPTLTQPELLARLLEARQWTDAFSAETGIPNGRVMLYPCNAYKVRDAQALKIWNFVAIANESWPTDAPVQSDWTFGASGVATFAGAAPIVTRREAPFMTPALDFALGRPVIGFYHPDAFGSNFGIFDARADQINGFGVVDWTSVGEIARRHVWQKRNLDGSYSARLFTPDAIVENTGSGQRTYAVELADDGTVPIDRVLVDGSSAAYTVSDGAIRLTVDVPGGSERQVRVLYREPASAEVATSTPTATNQSNLIADGGFEAGVDDWSAWHGDVGRAAGGRSGSYSAKLSWVLVPSDGSQTIYTISNWPGAAPNPGLGQTFSGVAWVKGEASAIGKQAWLVLREHNIDASVQDSAYGTAVALSDSWQKIVVQKTIYLTQTTNLDLFVEVRDGSAGSVVYLDDVSMVRAPLSSDPAPATPNATPTLAAGETRTPTATPTLIPTDTPTATPTSAAATSTPTPTPRPGGGVGMTPEPFHAFAPVVISG